ncbi:hypothetical protein T492DRAFT_899666 [Pavlovales sp. CCMP2436]|nr:hypothetical protein T492DRAFT_899666 [Pavlovales sp. CCMP2436]
MGQAQSIGALLGGDNSAMEADPPPVDLERVMELFKLKRDAYMMAGGTRCVLVDELRLALREAGAPPLSAKLDGMLHSVATAAQLAEAEALITLLGRKRAEYKDLDSDEVDSAVVATRLFALEAAMVADCVNFAEMSEGPVRFALGGGSAHDAGRPAFTALEEDAAVLGGDTDGEGAVRLAGTRVARALQARRRARRAADSRAVAAHGEGGTARLGGLRGDAWRLRPPIVGAPSGAVLLLRARPQPLDASTGLGQHPVTMGSEPARASAAVPPALVAASSYLVPSQPASGAPIFFFQQSAAAIAQISLNDGYFCLALEDLDPAAAAQAAALAAADADSGAAAVAAVAEARRRRAAMAVAGMQECRYA